MHLLCNVTSLRIKPANLEGIASDLPRNDIMGVIRKKTISKGYEGGLKYICDVCSKDITATVGRVSLIFMRRMYCPFAG